MCVDVLLFVYIFFFKQKTAYEMRISDWSSDVCSSDLFLQHDIAFQRGTFAAAIFPWPGDPQQPGRAEHAAERGIGRGPAIGQTHPMARRRRTSDKRTHLRSEEHTSELQSLMRISYAVFCLKKKNNNKIDIYTTTKIETTYHTRVSITNTTN